MRDLPAKQDLAGSTPGPRLQIIMDESTKQNIARMEEKLKIIPSENRHRIFAEQAIRENPKLVQQYFAGKGGILTQLVEYAVKNSFQRECDPHLVGEYIVLELIELHRSRLRARKEGR